MDQQIRSGALFTAYREAAGLTIAQCAALLQVDPRTVRAWEAEKYSVPAGVWPKMEQAVERVTSLAEEICEGRVTAIDRGDTIARAAAALAVQDAPDISIRWAS